MNRFEAEAVRLALVRMFRADGWFDICAVRTCLETANVTPPRRELKALEPLHCVSWSEMEPAMREEVRDRVLALFQSEYVLDVSALDQSLLAPPPEPVEAEDEEEPPVGVLRRLARKTGLVSREEG